MIDTEKLQDKISKSNLTVTKLCKSIGMTKATFYRRLSNNGEDFTVGEIERIVNSLNLSKKEARSIFFKNKVL